MSKGLPSPEKMKNQEIPRSTDLAKAKRLLAKIKPEEYDVWFQVGCALKSMGADYKMFRDWSAKSEKFDEDECRQKWGQLPDEPRAGLTTLCNLAKGVDICHAKAKATVKKKGRVVSSASDTVPHTQPIDHPAEGAYAGSAPASSDFLPPPEEMLPPPASEEERIGQAAWSIATLFRPGEYFELCGVRKRPDRIAPDRGKIQQLDDAATEENLCSDASLKEQIKAFSLGAYICMNPTEAPTGNVRGKAPCDAQVVDHRVALLENDELPIDEQWRLLKAMRLPVIAVTHSGNKSLHVLCRIDAGQDAKTYEARVEALYAYAASHGVKPDKSDRNPSRLTRCPGFMRDGKLQYLVSKSWGYPDWASFEAAELTNNQSSQDEQPTDTQNQAAKDDLEAEYGPAITFNHKGLPANLNQNYFAAFTTRHQSLILARGRAWTYDNETGLWGQICEEKLRTLIGSSVRYYGTQHALNLSPLIKARECDSIRAFMVPEDEDGPFDHRSNNVIHVQNGMLVLNGANGPELKPFAPEYYSLNRSEIAYDEHAQCPRFLHELLEPALSQEDIELLQMYCGQCLIGDNFTQKFLVLTGTAGAGKGTIVNIIKEVIGAKNCAELRTDQLGGRFEMARFMGKSLLLGPDVPTTFLLQKSAARIKSLCGHDLLTAEIKNVQEGATIYGRFNIIITANAQLLIRAQGDLDAWKRRILWIPFEQPKPKTAIRDFADILLREEGKGIQKWMADGANRLIETGYPEHSVSDDRVDDLLRQSDSVYGFLRARIEKTGDGSIVTAEDLLNAYDSWCQNNNWAPLPVYRAQESFRSGILSMYSVPQAHDIRRGLRFVRGWRGLVILKKDKNDGV